MFIETLFCAKHCAKSFVYIISLNAKDDFMK